MNNRVISASHNITTFFSRRAVTEIWTQDLFLTKEVLYHWAITASRAENGAQTRDPQLGRLVLYRLSYFRETSLESGCWWIRTTEVERQQIYSLPHLATLENTHLACAWFPILIGFRLSLSLLSDSNQRPRDYKSRALANWAKEAFLSSRSLIQIYDLSENGCKVTTYFWITKTFPSFFLSIPQFFLKFL